MENKKVIEPIAKEVRLALGLREKLSSFIKPLSEDSDINLFEVKMNGELFFPVEGFNVSEWVMLH